MKRSRLCLAVILILLFQTLGNCFAATFYVKNGGNDSNSGLSDAQAWKTISKINFSLSPGDDVYFKCGDIWDLDAENTDHLIPAKGSSEDHATVGAYYMDGGSETIGVNVDGKPVIDGGVHSTKTLPERPSKGTYDGLIKVAWKNYVDIENIKLQDSRGCGIFINETENCTVTGIDVDWTAATGILFDNNSDNGTIRRCIIHNTNFDHKYFGNSDWGFGAGSLESMNLTVSECTIYENWSEGIGFYKGADGCIAERNLVYDAEKIGIYISESEDCTIRHNLVYGTTNTLFHRSANFVGSGIRISHEGRSNDHTRSNSVYGNLVTNCAKGISIICDDNPSIELSRFENSSIVNNTLVDNGTGIYFYGNYFSNSICKNNIIWQPSGGNVFYQSSGSGFDGLTWSNNCWYPSQGQPGMDDIVADPKLLKTSGWRSLTGGNLNANDFALQTISPARDAGASLGTNFDVALECDESDFTAQKIITVSQDLQGNDWEIGADIISTEPSSKQLTSEPSSTQLTSPTNLRIDSP